MIGKNNGTIQGKVYFTCEPKKGVFVKEKQVSKLSTDVAATNPDSTKSNRNSDKKIPTSTTNVVVDASSKLEGPAAQVGATGDEIATSRPLTPASISVVPRASQLSNLSASNGRIDSRFGTGDAKEPPESHLPPGAIQMSMERLKQAELYVRIADAEGCTDTEPDLLKNEWELAELEKELALAHLEEMELLASFGAEKAMQKKKDGAGRSKAEKEDGFYLLFSPLLISVSIIWFFTVFVVPVLLSVIFIVLSGQLLNS